jgi:hypothetical protein
VLGFLWKEFDPQAKTIVESGRIVWSKGEGLLRPPDSRRRPDVDLRHTRTRHDHASGKDTKRPELGRAKPKGTKKRTTRRSRALNTD